MIQVWTVTAALFLGACASVRSVPESARAPRGRARPVASSADVTAVRCPGPDLARQDPQDPQRAGEPYRPWTGTDDRADWIRLVSGEWLRGRFEALRDGSVEFESDELGQLKLDWDDIVEVRILGQRVIVLDSGESMTGAIRVIDGRLAVAGAEARRIDRAEVLSIVDAADGGSAWSGRLSLGFTQRSGNTEQTDNSAFAFVRRETAETRWDSQYAGAFSRVNGEETANNHRLRSRLDWFWSKRFYVTPFGFDLFRDTFQNVALRVTPYVAAGYDIIDAGAVSWSVSAGPAYLSTRYDRVQPGAPDSKESVAAFVQSRFRWDVTPDIGLLFDYDITVPLPASQSYNHHAVSGLSIDLIGDFDVDITVVWDRNNSPAPDPLGRLPAQDDFRVSVGLGYEF